MENRRSKGEKIFEVANLILLLFLCIICIYPMLYVLFASLSDSTSLLSHTGLLLKPIGFSTLAYEVVFNTPLIITGYKNTLFILIVGLAVNLFMTSLGAYFLSRKDVLWKNTVMMLILLTMYFSGGLIPFYLNVRDLGLNNSLLAVILPFAVNTFNLIIMRTSFANIPDSLEESATLDGANDYQILFRIILPLSMPVVAVMVLYYGVAHWNAWFYAMIFINKSELLPLQVILREILIQNETAGMGGDVGGVVNIGETIKYATIIVATVPILVIYPFLQRYFVSGIMIGAVKG